MTRPSLASFFIKASLEGKNSTHIFSDREDPGKGKTWVWGRPGKEEDSGKGEDPGKGTTWERSRKGEDTGKEKTWERGRSGKDEDPGKRKTQERSRKGED